MKKIQIFKNNKKSKTLYCPIHNKKLSIKC